MLATRRGRDLAMSVAKLIIIAAWALAVSCVAIHAIPGNPLMPSARDRNRLRLVMPEGWAFFTKDAQQPDVFLYRRLGSTTLSLVEGRSYRSFPPAAIDRRGRLRRGSVASLIDLIGPDKWSDCRGDLAACARAHGIAPATVVAPPFLEMCGELLVERRKPTPWAWYRRNRDFRMPSQIAKVVISC